MSHCPDKTDPPLPVAPPYDENPEWGSAEPDYAAYDEWAAAAEAPAFAPTVNPRSFDAIAATLTETQVSAATHPGSILVLAGAGTGKTSTLTAAVAHRIAVDGVLPGRVLAVTFTNKAAAEMAHRIRAAIGPDAAPHWLGTFHGLAARQLRSAPDVASLRTGFDILDADDARRVLRRVMKAMNVATDDDEGGRRDPVKTVADTISKFKDRLMPPAGALAFAEKQIAAANREVRPIAASGLLIGNTSASCARRTRPISATCCSGRPSPC